MKKFLKGYDKFIHSLPRWATVLICVILVGAGALAVWNAPAGFIAYVLIVGAIAVKSSRVAKTLLTVTLIACLLYSDTPAPAQSNPHDRAVECNATIIVGVIIICIGVFIVYKLCQFCRRHFPANGNPNSPPSTPGTNSPPDNTAAIRIPPMPTDPNLVSYDCSQMGWIDHTQTNNPVPFQDYIQLVLLSSEDMQTWTNYGTVTMWLSENSMETVFSDANGNGLRTNWFPGNPYLGMTNRIDWPLVDPKIPAKFFKWQ